MALTDLKIRTAKPKEKPYKISDALGLYLHVFPNGSKYWRMRYRFDGKEKLLSFGVYPEVTLSKARLKREEARSLLSEGIDPNASKEDTDDKGKPIIKFRDVAYDWHISNNRWSEHHRKRVFKSLEDNLFPAIGDKDISKLSTRDLWLPIKAVEESERIEVAQRILQRICNTPIFNSN